MSKITIIEDEVIIAENLRRIVVKLGYEVVAVANSFDEAWHEISLNRCHLYLVDINLGEGKNSGIKLAEKINQETGKPFIYITSNADAKTVHQAKLSKPAGYIVKPFSNETIFSTLEIALFNQQILPKGLMIRHNSKRMIVPFKDILYIKASTVYIEIITINQQKFLHRESFKNLATILPPQFVQIHRSYIVNLSKVSSLKSNLVFIEDIELPVGRTYKPKLTHLLSS